MEDEELEVFGVDGIDSHVIWWPRGGVNGIRLTTESYEGIWLFGEIFFGREVFGAARGTLWTEEVETKAH